MKLRQWEPRSHLQQCSVFCTVGSEGVQEQAPRSRTASARFVPSRVEVLTSSVPTGFRWAAAGGNTSRQRLSRIVHGNQRARLGRHAAEGRAPEHPRPRGNKGVRREPDYPGVLLVKTANRQSEPPRDCRARGRGEVEEHHDEAPTPDKQRPQRHARCARTTSRGGPRRRPGSPRVTCRTSADVRGAPGRS